MISVHLTERSLNYFILKTMNRKRYLSLSLPHLASSLSYCISAKTTALTHAKHIQHLVFLVLTFHSHNKRSLIPTSHVHSVC